MAQERIPDLKLLIIELLSESAKRWPTMVEQNDVDRIRGADDVLLVGARVAAVIARRAGITQEEIAAMIARSTIVAPVEVVGADFDPDKDAKLEEVPSVTLLMWRMDDALADPTRRGNIPDWFVDRYYPEFLRRMAMGNKPTSREQSILMTILEKAGGRRG